MSSAPIGIFDSGIGGLTIYHELVKMLPKEQFIYLADSNHAPYGERPPEDIERFSFVNSQFLIDKGCKLIVVACNTATTIAVKKLRQSFQVPFIGIEPAIKPAALQSSRKKVGVLATRGTLNSTLFQETYQRFGQDVETTIQVGKGLVELIEAGKKNSVEMTALLQKHLQPMIDNEVDYIVLGCTHYPFLKDQIQELTPKDVEIIDSGEAVARQTKSILKSHNLLNHSEKEKDQFYINGNPTVMNSILKEVLNIDAEVTPL